MTECNNGIYATIYFVKWIWWLFSLSAGRLWKEMDEEEKKEWTDAAAVEKKKHDKAMEKYNEVSY